MQQWDSLKILPELMSFGHVDLIPPSLCLPKFEYFQKNNDVLVELVILLFETINMLLR